MTNIKHGTKQSASHTPGPWQIVPCPDGGWRRYITKLGDEHYYALAETDERNADLIVSAPRMLEALERIVAILPSGTQPWEANSQEMLARETAMAAIAEAKGLAA